MSVAKIPILFGELIKSNHNLKTQIEEREEKIKIPYIRSQKKKILFSFYSTLEDFCSIKIKFRFW